MAIFKEFGINVVPHFAPLHYLPYISRTKALKSKPTLRRDGFSDTHFRSKSAHHDVERGFGNYAFLTLHTEPSILKAKLEGGFPHIAINVPEEAFNNVPFDLCRYNVAMTRYLRRNGKAGAAESSSNGTYYENKLIPIARTDEAKRSLIKANYQQGTMIEVLVPDELPLPDNTSITCYSHEDKLLIQNILRFTNCPWQVGVQPPPVKYNRSQNHSKSVEEFIQHCLKDPNWLGNGLDFDKV